MRKLLSFIVALAIACARLVWGFAGGPFARFSGFLASPVATFRYARDVLARSARCA